MKKENGNRTSLSSGPTAFPLSALGRTSCEVYDNRMGQKHYRMSA